jgi:hypothetical protein
MSVIQEVKSLSPLRKNQQIMSFFLLFVNAMLIAVTTSLYIKAFGTEGLILKDYAISLYGLILFIPILGKLAMQYPLRAFTVALFLEAASVIAYFLVSKSFHEHLLLPIATLCIISSSLIMRPILVQVDSLVTNGCSNYSLLKSKLDALYTSIGALFGGYCIFANVSISFSIIIYATSLVMARYYRKKVLDEIFNTPKVLEPETNLVNKSAY